MIWGAEDGSRAERASLPALFIGFLKVALYGVGGGGGIVFARRLVVEQRRWIGDCDFADILSLCQFMPGPNIVGIAVCVGSRLRGPAGALAGLAGFTVIPLTISFSLGTWCLRNTDLAILQGILGGVSAAAAGLLIGTGLRLLIPHRDQPMALCFALLAFVGLVFTKLPLLAILLAVAPVSVTVAAISGTRKR
jgi:chromate transporter